MWFVGPQKATRIARIRAATSLSSCFRSLGEETRTAVSEEIEDDISVPEELPRRT